MTRTEHLLTILAEECSEVAQRVSKALRFGLKEVQPEQGLNNAERIRQEFWDLLGVILMLEREGLLPKLWVQVVGIDSMSATAEKKLKVEGYLRYSASRGLVDGMPAEPAPNPPKCEHKVNPFTRRCEKCGFAEHLFPAEDTHQ